MPQTATSTSPKTKRWLFAAIMFAVLVISVALFFSSTKARFETLAPGLEYLDLALPDGARAHVFRADLSRWRPISVLAKRGEREVATAQELAQESGAVLMLNGNFFDQGLRPLGLLISGGQTLNPLRKNVDWGVLALEDGRLSIKHTSEITELPKAEFAVQCGPRILIHGEVPKLKPQSFARTALGVTNDNRLLLLVTYQAPVYADALGLAMRAELQATDALLLDGGPSTQLYASLQSFTIDRPGGASVASGVGLLPR